jgi:hypothetical protein
MPTQEFNESDRQQILANARLKIPESMQVVIEIVDDLVRTEQMKTPFVIRRTSSEGTR